MAIKINLHPTTEDLAGKSHWWGFPDLPEDFEWPCNNDGDLLTFICQIRLEEIAEFEVEVENMDADKAEAEFGDVMFSLINAARLYKINPDNALERTNQKFIRRFNYLEEHTIQQGRNLKDMTLEEMDAIWDEAKKNGL